ncbi:condensation domain-containing protein [Heliobacterium mobile]|nr:condensation domain-containing protein [Heliobacterium mobile]
MADVQASLRMPASASDLFNYISRYIGCNHQIHCILKVNGLVDVTLLRKSLTLAIEAEPVLRCRFVEQDPFSFWEQYDDIDSIELCSLVETDQTEAELHRFVNAPVDSYRDPQIQIRILRSGPSDLLCFKIDHACSDAGGLKACVSLIASMYNRLCIDPAYKLEHKKVGNRDQSQLFPHLNISDVKEAWERQPNRSRSTILSFPFRSDDNVTPEFVTTPFDPIHFHKLRRYAHQKGVTLNDILLTALYRTLFATTDPPAGRLIPLQVTVDLRQFLPIKQADAICNLSGIITPMIERVSGESFSDTLMKVSTMMQELKRFAPGIRSVLLSEIYGRLGFREYYDWLMSGWNRSVETKSYPPIFSNIGKISDGKIHFGALEVTDGYMIGPALCTPGSLIAASTYQDRLTLAMAFYEPAISRNRVAQFFDSMIREIYLAIGAQPAQVPVRKSVIAYNLSAY